MVRVRRPSRRAAQARLLVGTALVCGALVSGFPMSAASAASTVSGRVFYDTAMNGKYDGTDRGIAGVKVKAYDATGALVGETTTTTVSNSTAGKYSISVSTDTGKHLRIEFEHPVTYEPSFASTTLSSVQFVKAGATNVDYGIQVPGDFCANNTSKIASVCMYQGPTDGGTYALPNMGIAGQTNNDNDRILGLSVWNPPTTTGPAGDPVAADQTAIDTLTTKVEIGAAWGLGYQADKKLLWNSAVIRRHAALGPKGIGGVYVTNLAGTTVASFDLEAAPYNLVLKDTTGNLSDFSNSARDIQNSISTSPSRTYLTQSRDLPGFEGVGKAGIGDIDVSRDSAHLWVVNLFEKKLHRIAIGGTAAAPTLGAVTSWPVSDGHTCADATSPLRTWGIDPQDDGTVIVSGVCTKEGAASATAFPGEGVIMQLDPTKSGAAAWSLVTTVDFSYTHGYDNCSTAPRQCHWHVWSDDYASIKATQPAGSQVWYTQPMILDVERLADGSFVLGVSDRMSYQGGATNYAPKATVEWLETWTAGDMILVCRTASGYAQESGGKCEGDVTYKSPRTAEFFYDEHGHPETVIGGLAVGAGQVAVAAMDPVLYYTSGVRWVSTADGSATNGLTLNSTMGKVSAIGDLEAICDMAPVQIGNRVWFDNDKDGIQDADEPPVPGVTVRLYAADGTTLLGTAVTNSAGEYYFDSTVTEAAGGDGNHVGGGLTAGATFVVRIDLPADFAAGGPLDQCALTSTDAMDATSAFDDTIDNDATQVASAWSITTLATKAGFNNHTYDFGCHKPGVASLDSAAVTTTAPSAAVTTTTVAGSTSKSSAVGKVSIGNFVWRDLNGDGLQGRFDRGVKGAKLSVRNLDGSAVTDVNGRKVGSIVTKADGRYLFKNLPPGRYVVRITYPKWASPTTPDRPDRKLNSSSFSAKSVDLAAGQSDMTLDFGVVNRGLMLPATR